MEAIPVDTKELLGLGGELTGIASPGELAVLKLEAERRECAIKIKSRMMKGQGRGQ